ncbi:ribosome-associated translation inhibitor RaiA [Thermosulfuriphilus ammonigenes]|uniref:Ribosome hibernation promoting factor n=1 Tax=Thermosulfuriphilus ammonigenes TaxID=1936021 RepID=A0A6G7PX50_9BACT|nr:ribosome-associated translation inhibitor RaiA [Thermosulfuriphilus ammonigenes]MBA2849636.1 putative sigma-54 modulation protein [Thermosulfuriphilus ammonigenes]QIJ72264.1 ribosome-associated translation inhibitor RaiA [Thermosulfuriphilus ammonigenes]
MQINVTFRRLDPSQGLKDYAVKRLSKLAKYFGGPTEVNVILTTEKFRQIAEVVITGNGLNLSGKEETNDMYSAIDLVVDKMERQLRRHREKIKSHKGRGPGRTVTASAAPVESEGKNVVVEQVTAKPLSVEEAIDQLELMGYQFLVFVNADTESLNVIYRRPDGHYGLIQPESL